MNKQKLFKTAKNLKHQVLSIRKSGQTVSFEEDTEKGKVKIQISGKRTGCIDITLNQNCYGLCSGHSSVIWNYKRKISFSFEQAFEQAFKEAEENLKKDINKTLEMTKPGLLANKELRFS